jgi:hypothetical protein
MYNYVIYLYFLMFIINIYIIIVGHNTHLNHTIAVGVQHGWQMNMNVLLVIRLAALF